MKNPTVTAAIVGVRNAQQAKGKVGGASIELTSDEVAEIGGSCCAGSGLIARTADKPNCWRKYSLEKQAAKKKMQ